MVSSTNLFTINEHQSELNAQNAYIKTSNYDTARVNPMNALSIYIRSFEFIKQVCEWGISEYQATKKPLNKKIHEKLQLSAKQRVQMYYKIEKISKIIEEFRKGFALPENHQLYTNFKDVNGRFTYIEEQILLAYNTSSPQYLEEAKIVTQQLIDFFIKMQSIVQDTIER